MPRYTLQISEPKELATMKQAQRERRESQLPELTLNPSIEESNAVIWDCVMQLLGPALQKKGFKVMASDLENFTLTVEGQGTEEDIHTADVHHDIFCIMQESGDEARELIFEFDDDMQLPPDWDLHKGLMYGDPVPKK